MMRGCVNAMMWGERRRKDEGSKGQRERKAEVSRMKEEEGEDERPFDRLRAGDEEEDEEVISNS